jgi:hypothetical protein
MLITFRSQAAGDVMMFGNVAMQMLRIIGKEPADKGIITLVQLPEAIAALKKTIAADKAPRTEHPSHGKVKSDPKPDDGQDQFVSASQRAQPLLELLEWSLKSDKPVLWEA